MKTIPSWLLIPLVLVGFVIFCVLCLAGMILVPLAIGLVAAAIPGWIWWGAFCAGMGCWLMWYLAEQKR